MEKLKNSYRAYRAATQPGFGNKTNRIMKIWFAAGSYFLFLAVLMHASGHFVFYINESGFDSERVSLMNTMKAYIADKMLFQTSMWTLLKMFSMSFSLLFLFAGSMNLLILKGDLPTDFLQKVALFNAIFWFVSFLLFTILNPAIQPISICFIASLLFGISYLLSRN